MEDDAGTLPKCSVWGGAVVIVVLVGTNPYSFERLVKAVDDIAADGKKEFFVQLGNTPYEPHNCSFERFIDKPVLEEMMEVADVVICHGGFGSIRDGLAHGKPVIAVPRQQALGECMDRQEELVRELEDQGRILAVYDIAALEEAIEKAKSFHGNQGERNRIPQIISDYLRQSFPGI